MAQLLWQGKEYLCFVWGVMGVECGGQRERERGREGERMDRWWEEDMRMSSQGLQESVMLSLALINQSHQPFHTQHKSG